jgi:hypothetical protein
MIRRRTIWALSLVAAGLCLASAGAAQAYEVRADGTVCVERPDGNCDIMTLEEAQALEGHPTPGYNSTTVVATPGYVAITRAPVTAYNGITCEQGRRVAKRYVRNQGYGTVSVVSCDGPVYVYCAEAKHGQSAYVRVDSDGDVIAFEPIVY